MPRTFRLTVPFPRIPAFMLGAATSLIVVATFMALDQTVGHWYVPEVAPVSERLETHIAESAELPADVSDLSTDVSDLSTRVRSLERSVDTLEEPDPTEWTLIFKGNFDRDLAIQRLATVVTLNSLVMSLGAPQSTTSPQGKACQAWLMDGEGSGSDCGFVPTE